MRRNSHSPFSSTSQGFPGKPEQGPSPVLLSTNSPSIPVLTALLTILFSLGLAAQTDKDFEGQGAMLAARLQARSPKAEREEDGNGQKSVLGQVVDTEGEGLARAVVHLKNKRSQEVTTHISNDRGNFRFRGLNPNVDYEVHAEFNGGSSPTRSVSSFDSSQEIYLVLKIDTSK